MKGVYFSPSTFLELANLPSHEWKRYVVYQLFRVYIPPIGFSYHRRNMLFLCALILYSIRNSAFRNAHTSSTCSCHLQIRSLSFLLFVSHTPIYHSRAGF